MGIQIWHPCQYCQCCTFVKISNSQIIDTLKSVRIYLSRYYELFLNTIKPVLVVADVDMLKQILVKDFSKFNARKASDQSMKIGTNSKDDTLLFKLVYIYASQIG